MPRYHPDAALLLDYASGSLSEPPALAVATHLAFCAECRAEVGHQEAVGGALFEVLPPDPVSDNLLSSMLARLDLPEEIEVARSSAPPSMDPGIPMPLRDYVPGSLSDIAWRWRSPGLADWRLPIGGGRFAVQLMRMGPGRKAPAHVHDGMELTLVLAGGYSDGAGHYLRGDLAMADDTTGHSPKADPDEDCIALVVVEGPIRLTGRFGRLLNPLLRV